MNARLLIPTGLKRILFSILVGAAVTALAFLVGPRVPWISGILGFPGILASWFRFGVHSSGPAAYAFIVNTMFWGAITFSALHLKKLSAGNKGWWPIPKQ
jgi:hypothetical protein